jgi:predicted acyltransferase
MSMASATVADSVEQASPSATRLFSLDLLRGVTIAAMIVVNNQGPEAYAPLKHAEWNGWTPTDLIFPFFLFIVGVSLVLSFTARLQRGSSRRSLLLHTVRRSALLFLIGVALNGMASVHLATWRIPGVLQRIAVVYCIAAIITLYSRTRTRALLIALFTIGYWWLMRFVPVPGYGLPGVDIPLLHPEHNLASYLDRKLMLGHMWTPNHDPEGLLSTIPAIATALCGVLTGEWLQTKRTPESKVVGMVAIGIVGVVAGEIWNRWFPINKNLWTSSYVVFTAGAALITLAACCWVTDVKLHRGPWTRPFLILGTNAITAYVLSELIGGGFAWAGINPVHHLALHSAQVASLFQSLLILALCFLPVWMMYRKKIFVKI